jgi:hypothetical protein
VSRPRSLVLLLTILALIYMAANWPRPVEVVETKYCVIDFPAAYKDRDGKWVKVWGRGYGLCSEMDRFEFI